MCPSACAVKFISPKKIKLFICRSSVFGKTLSLYPIRVLVFLKNISVFLWIGRNLASLAKDLIPYSFLFANHHSISQNVLRNVNFRSSSKLVVYFFVLKWGLAGLLAWNRNLYFFRPKSTILQTVSSRPAGCANVRKTRVLKETHCVCKQNFLEKVQRKVEAELKRIDGEGRHPHLRTHSTKERKKNPKKKRRE